MTTVAYVLDHYVELSETFVRNEIRELRRQGLHVKVVSLHRGDTSASADEPVEYLFEKYQGKLRLGAAHVRLACTHPLRFRRFVGAAIEFRAEAVPWRNLPLLALALRAEKVDWLHAHFGWRAAATARTLSALTGIGWSMTLHAGDMFERQVNLDAKLHAADHVVTVCEYNRRWLQQRHQGPLPLSVVICGVEVPPPSGPVAKHIDVISVGRLVPKKGLDVLLAAVRDLAQERPSLRVEIIGEGPERSALARAISESGLNRHVELVGALPHAEVMKRIEQAHVFCLPVRIVAGGDRDSMPVVIKEAMAHAVPVVSTTEVGVPEMVDESCGRLVPPEDPNALAAALAELLGRPALARQLGAAGRARVAARFSLSTEVTKLRRLFEQLARSGSATGADPGGPSSAELSPPERCITV